MSRRVRILPTGAANLRSVQVAFKSLVDEVVLIDSPDQILDPAPMVLPGVGAFGPAMEGLRESGRDALIRERIANGLPTLCICLGMQLLLEGSEEAPGVDGLGLAEGVARRFEGSMRVPQMGWNSVEGTFFYFANSFRLADGPTGWNCAMADYGGQFVASMRKAKVLACQFHPELSGAGGVNLIQEWLDAS